MQIIYYKVHIDHDVLLWPFNHLRLENLTKTGMGLFTELLVTCCHNRIKIKS